MMVISNSQSSSYPSTLTFTWLQSGCLATDSHLWSVAPKSLDRHLQPSVLAFPKSQWGSLQRRLQIIEISLPQLCTFSMLATSTHQHTLNTPPSHPHAPSWSTLHFPWARLCTSTILCPLYNLQLVLSHLPCALMHFSCIILWFLHTLLHYP